MVPSCGIFHCLIPYLQWCCLVLPVKIASLLYVSSLDFFFGCLALYVISDCLYCLDGLQDILYIFWIGASVGASPMSANWKGIVVSGPYIILIIRDLPALACLVLWTEKIECRHFIQFHWSSVHLKILQCIPICFVCFIHSTKPFACGLYGEVMCIVFIILYSNPAHYLQIPYTDLLYVYLSSHNNASS